MVTAVMMITGLMRKRYASINDVKIQESERRVL